MGDARARRRHAPIITAVIASLPAVARVAPPGAEPPPAPPPPDGPRIGPSRSATRSTRGASSVSCRMPSTRSCRSSGSSSRGSFMRHLGLGGARRRPGGVRGRAAGASSPFAAGSRPHILASASARRRAAGRPRACRHPARRAAGAPSGVPRAARRACSSRRGASSRCRAARSASSAQRRARAGEPRSSRCRTARLAATRRDGATRFAMHDHENLLASILELRVSHAHEPEQAPDVRRVLREQGRDGRRHRPGCPRYAWAGWIYQNARISRHAVSAPYTGEAVKTATSAAPERTTNLGAPNGT